MAPYWTTLRALAILGEVEGWTITVHAWESGETYYILHHPDDCAELRSELLDIYDDAYGWGDIAAPEEA